jgi:Ca-activated chloride channel family protein
MKLPKLLPSVVTLFVALAMMGLPSFAKSQGTGIHQLILHVRNPDDTPVANTEVEFIEVHTRERIVRKTDATGSLTYQFTSGHFWQFNVLDVRDYFPWQFERMENKNIKEEHTVTYSYERYLRETRPAVDRSKIALTKVPQSFSVTDKATETESMVHITLGKKDKSPLSNFPVELTCYKLGKTFVAKTNAAGTACFKVPVSQEYEIDIDGIPSFSYIDLVGTKYYTAKRTLTYEPTVVNEKIANDTVRQILAADVSATSARVLVHVYFKKQGGTFWQGENVYLTEINGKLTYVAKTNMNGEATFLIPKGKSYMIHGNYERDIDVLNFTRNRGIGYNNKWVNYRPLERLQYPERYIPTPDQLIVQEFTDFLTKQYPSPMDGTLIRPDHAWGGPVGSGSKEAMLRLSFTAANEVANAHTTPLNICLVIDKSGSMAGEERMDQLKESLYAFLDQLRPDDIVSLVTFESFHTTLFQAQKLSTGKEKLKHAIYMIEAGGGTTILPGLKEGYAQVSKNLRPGITNRVILLTDGYGDDDPNEMLAAQKPFTDKGISLSCVGVGSDYNVALLKLLSARGGGLISHVGASEEMRKVFLNELNSAMYPVASDVEVTVEFGDKLEYKQLHGFPLKEKGKGYLKLKLPTFYKGMNQLALLQFKVNGADESITQQPVKVTIRYKDLRTNKVEQIVSDMPLRWSPSSGEPVIAEDEEEKLMLGVAVLNQALKVMSEAFEAGDRPKAKMVLENALSEVGRIYPNASNADFNQLVERVSGYYEILSQLK